MVSKVDNIVVSDHTAHHPASLKNEVALRVHDVRKSYGTVQALAGVDLSVSFGEILSLVGPNGAGKTTLVEILEGYRKRDSGDAEVLGQDPAHPTTRWRERIGLVLQSCQMPPELTARELVERYAGYYAHPFGVDETIELVNLTKKADERAGHLSGGEQRRLDVALGLIGNPDLVFLDEPTTGFDPNARHEAWDMLANLKKLGKTILLTTHYMDEAEALADRVAVIVHGKIVAEGPPGELGGRESAASTVRFRLPLGLTEDQLPSIPGDETRSINGQMMVSTRTPVATVGALCDWARARGLELPDLVVSHPSLEDIYLDLTRRSS